MITTFICELFFYLFENNHLFINVITHFVSREERQAGWLVKHCPTDLF